MLKLSIVSLILFFLSLNTYAQVEVKTGKPTPPNKVKAAPANAPTTAPETGQASSNIPATNPPKIEKKDERLKEQAKDITPSEPLTPTVQEEIVVTPTQQNTRTLEKIDLSQEIQKSKNLKHEVIRRVTFFPFFTNGKYQKESEMAWWKSREFLSEQQRFLVSTKRFLEQKDVFQARKALRITDAVLLSKILDSDCLITGYIDNKNLIMDAYSGQDGQLLWSKSTPLVAAKPVSEQLEEAALKLTQDFLAAIPYQGFQIVDPLNDKPYVEEGSNIFVRVDVGAKSAAVKGQKVQWIDVERTNSYPLFQGGSIVKIVAEGEVVSNENQVVTVSVKRSKDLSLLEKKSIVHFPDEGRRLQTMYSIKDPINTEASTAYLSEPMVDTEKRYKESRPLLTALASIGNVILFLILAL